MTNQGKGRWLRGNKWTGQKPSGQVHLGDRQGRREAGTAKTEDPDHMASRKRQEETKERRNVMWHQIQPEGWFGRVLSGCCSVSHFARVSV